MRSRRHDDLFVAVHDKTHAAVLHRNAVKCLLKTDKVPAACRSFAEHAEVVHIQDAKQGRVLREERTAGFFGRA
jgi:hypothetical protein